jgi:hypothetical protein
MDRCSFVRPFFQCPNQSNHFNNVKNDNKTMEQNILNDNNMNDNKTMEQNILNDKFSRYIVNENKTMEQHILNDNILSKYYCE